MICLDQLYQFVSKYNNFLFLVKQINTKIVVIKCNNLLIPHASNVTILQCAQTHTTEHESKSLQ